MLTIPTELDSFKDNVSGSIESMDSTISIISSKLGELQNACTSAKNGVSSFYKSDKLSSILDKFSELDGLIKQVTESVSSNLLSMLSKAKEINGKIEQLEKLINDVNEKEKLINDIKLQDEFDSVNFNNVINDRNNIVKDFEKLKTETINALNELKSRDSLINVATPNEGGSPQELVKDPITGEFRYDLLNLQEGTYTEVSYTGKNGKTIKTFIYLPVGAKSVTGLSVDLSMGGDESKNAEGSRNESSHGRGGLGSGVGQQLKKGAQYSGIVVILEAYNDKSYSDPYYLDTAKELADDIVKTYNANPDKVSINGYSYGGAGVIHMVERFPDYFSQAVIVAQGNGAVGKESQGNKALGYEKLKNTKIHLICGTNDFVYSQMVSMSNELSKGGIVTHEWLKGVDHGSNSFNPVTINGKTYDNYVEFCLAQSRN